MPTNRKRITRKLKSVLTDNVRRYLETGESTENDVDVYILQVAPEQLRDSWESQKEIIMPEWIEKYPGTRPFAWWEFTSPRWERKFEAYYDGKLPEPRLMIGGVGTPIYDVLSYMPHFSFGIPTGWVTKWDEDYYNGRAKDIHGKIIPTNYKEGNFAGKGVDPDDPPTFESQAAYLERHGLLTEAEKKRLKPSDFKPVKIEVS